MIAHRIDWWTLHEITMASVLPIVTPMRAARRVRTVKPLGCWGGGGRVPASCTVPEYGDSGEVMKREGRHESNANTLIPLSRLQ